jgi:hypothetical protein
VTGVIATTAAVLVIAALMVIGIKMKPRPPDPDWRDDLPPPPPAPSAAWRLFRFGPVALFIVGLVTGGVWAALSDEGRPPIWLIAIFIVYPVLRVAGAISWAIHVRRYWRSLGYQSRRERAGSEHHTQAAR